MPAGGSSGVAGQNGLKRINTGLSESSGHHHAPRSSGSGRLSLHIPNAHPRALSPRSPLSNTSKNPTPESSRPASPFEDRPSRASVFGALKGAQEHFSDDDASGRGKRSRSNSRTGTPRVRVFRRDSSLITIHQIDDDGHQDDGPSGGGRGVELQVSSTSTSAQIMLRPFLAVRIFFRTKETSSSSARDFLARERNFFVWLRLSCLLAILSASIILQLQLPDSAHTSSSPDDHDRHHHHPRKRRPSDGGPVDWDNLPLSSKAFAGIFFVLSILSLGTGLADYLSAERQLEKEQVDFDETEGVFLNDGHTSGFVHAVMLIVGVGITASALWLLAY